MTVNIPSNVKDPDLVRTRRARIVEAAVRLFTEKGFHKTTTREIAQAAGLSNGALYEYVQSKEDVLYLVCQHIHREVRFQLEDKLMEHASGAVKLQSAIRSFLRVMDDMQADVLLIYQESKSLPKPFLSAVLQEEQAITSIFENILREGLQDGSLRVTPSAIELLAHNIVVCGQMWAFRRWAMKQVAFEQFADLQVRMLMQACGADPASLNPTEEGSV